VKAPKESAPEGTKPDSVKPTTFERVLGNEATLFDVLKPSIAGKDGKYRVYVGSKNSKRITMTWFFRV